MKSDKKKPTKSAKVQKSFKDDVHIPVPFPAKDFEHLPDGPLPLPCDLPPVEDDFKVSCKVVSIGMNYWGMGNTLHVAIEATDGQNLLDLIRKDQEVVLHYQK